MYKIFNYIGRVVYRTKSWIAAVNRLAYLRLHDVDHKSGYYGSWEK